MPVRTPSRRITRALLLLSGLCGLWLDRAAAARTEILLTGVVRDAGGAPLPGVRLSLAPLATGYESGLEELGVGSSSEIASALSGAAGRYELAAPEPGMWRLIARAAGRVPMEQRLVPLLEGGELPPLVLARDAGQRALVTGTSGRAVAGARVAGLTVPRSSLWLAQARRGWVPARRFATSNGHGVAVLPRGEGETLGLVASSAGHLPSAPIEAAGGSVTLVLGGGRARQVEVRDQDGAPVSGALIRIEGRFLPSGLTGGDGRSLVFTAASSKTSGAAETAPAAVKVLVEDREERTGSALLSADGLAARIELARGLGAAGQVVEEGGGRPIAGALVWSSVEPWRATATRDDGSWRLPGAAGARSALRVAAAGFQTAQAPAKTLALRRAAALDGIVTSLAGTPVVEAEVTAEAAGTLAHLAWSTPAGTFRLSGLDPDRPLTVTAAKSGYSPARAVLARPAPRDAGPALRLVLLALPKAVGQVVDSRGRPIGGAAVTWLAERAAALGSTPAPAIAAAAGTLVPPAGPGADHPGAPSGAGVQLPRVLSASDGRFEVIDPPPGRGELVVTHAGFAPALRLVEMPAGWPRPVLDVLDLGAVALATGVPLRLVVRDPRGKPVAGARASIQAPGAFRPAAEDAARQDRVEPGRDQQATPVPASPQALAKAPASSADPGGPMAPVFTDTAGTAEILDLASEERYLVRVSRDGYREALLRNVRAGAEAPLPVTLAPLAKISGRVLAPDGTSVAGALVEATEADREQGRPAVWSARSRSGGGFELSGVPPGRVRLAASAKGYSTTRLSRLEIPPEGLAGLEVTLRPGASLGGRVLDAEGQPVAGARVALAASGAPPEAAHGNEGLPLQVESDASGSYFFRDLVPGAAEVRATHPAFPAVSRQLELAEGDNILDLVFAGGASVAGFVVDEAASAVGGAMVSLQAVSENATPRSQASGDDGSFRFDNVPAAAYRCFAEKQGYAGTDPPAALQVGADPVAGVLLTLRRGATVRGTLRGLKGDELPRVRVAALGGGGLREGEVLPDGTYQLTSLPPGSWVLRATIAGSARHASGEVAVAAADSVVTQDLDFTGTITLSGLVSRNGTPAPGLRVVAKSASATIEAQTDDRGAFSFAGLDAGTWLLVASGAAGEILHQERLDLTGDRALTIDVTTNSLGGVVVDATTARPVAGATVALAMAASLPPIIQVQSDTSGAFNLTGVPQGVFHLLVRCAGYKALDLPVSVQSSEPIELRLALPRGP